MDNPGIEAMKYFLNVLLVNRHILFKEKQTE